MAGLCLRETWTVSAFLGVRLWQGAELYDNPELLQGFGLVGTFGAGGFPNGEAQKSNFPFPQYSTSRLFLRQEIGLGGEREKVDGEYGQLSGEKDTSRLTFQVGRFSVHDFFDQNTYAQDPRVDFLNWSVWATGAFDYPADKIGLTYGATRVEPTELDPAGRLFLVGNEPNSNAFDMNLFTRGGYAAELELRFRPYNRPGAVRLGCRFIQRGHGARRPRPEHDPDRQRHHRADPPGPYQIRLLPQPRAGDHRQCRHVRALQLE
jgi:high affinity Mn2+ porin